MLFEHCSLTNSAKSVTKYLNLLKKIVDCMIVHLLVPELEIPSTLFSSLSILFLLNRATFCTIQGLNDRGSIFRGIAEVKHLFRDPNSK